MAPFYSFLTVNYARTHQLRALADSLLEYADVSFEWIIVDNFSSTKERERLAQFQTEYREKGMRIEVIYLQENVGFGGANNTATDYAKGDYIALLNPDTKLLQQDTFIKLSALLTDNNWLAVPWLVDEYGADIGNTCAFPRLFEMIKSFGNARILKPKMNTMLYPDWAQGSFWVMKRETFMRLGGFDERYFLFLEDVDLCKTMAEKGAKVACDPTILAHHDSHRLTGTNNKLTAILKKGFWWHLSSYIKYCKKWGIS